MNSYINVNKEKIEAICLKTISYIEKEREYFKENEIQKILNKKRFFKKIKTHDEAKTVLLKKSEMINMEVFGFYIVI